MRRLFLAVLVTLASSASAQKLETATLHAERISCEACAAVITKALRNVPGVNKVEVDVANKTVVIWFDPAKASVTDLTAATARKGFPSTLRKASP